MVRCVHEVAGYTSINNGYNIVVSEKVWCSATLWFWRFPKNQLIPSQEVCAMWSRLVLYAPDLPSKENTWENWIDVFVMIISVLTSSLVVGLSLRIRFANVLVWLLCVWTVTNECNMCL